jgi:hypothetical protein
MWVGVTSLENPHQLSGCTRVLTTSAKTNPVIRKVIAKSLARIKVKVSELSAISTEVRAGAWRCSKITWHPTRARARIAKRKCKTVNLRIDQDVTVADARIHATISSPRNGTTDAKFKITNAAQYDIFPETTT